MKYTIPKLETPGLGLTTPILQAFKGFFKDFQGNGSIPGSKLDEKFWWSLQLLDQLDCLSSQKVVFVCSGHQLLFKNFD